MYLKGQKVINRKSNLLRIPCGSVPRLLHEMNQIVKEMSHHIKCSLCPSEIVYVKIISNKPDHKTYIRINSVIKQHKQE